MKGVEDILGGDYKDKLAIGAIFSIFLYAWHLIYKYNT